MTLKSNSNSESPAVIISKSVFYAIAFLGRERIGRAVHCLLEPQRTNILVRMFEEQMQMGDFGFACKIAGWIPGTKGSERREKAFSAQIEDHRRMVARDHPESFSVSQRNKELRVILKDEIALGQIELALETARCLERDLTPVELKKILKAQIEKKWINNPLLTAKLLGLKYDTQDLLVIYEIQKNNRRFDQAGLTAAALPEPHRAEKLRHVFERQRLSGGDRESALKTVDLILQRS